MQFNSEANDQDLCTLADLLAKTDDTDFPLKEKSLYANWGLRELFRHIYQVYGGWAIQDSNVSGTQEVTVNLVADGTQFYTFATVAWIAGVEYQDANGDRFKLDPITLEQIREMGYAENEFMSTAGTPEYYRPVKNGIKIYPSSDTAVTAGLIVQIGAQDISPFTPASTTAVPGYDSLAGHEAVAAYMAMKYAQIHTLDSFAGLLNDWLTALAGVKNHYKKKWDMDKPPAIRKSNRIVDQYV
jgi:hypothetical protein